MKYIIILLVLLSTFIHLRSEESKNQSYTYILKRSFEVAGRQGVAVDKDHYYVSGSKSIYKYSRNGKLVSKNIDPFKNYTVAANHIGDIDVYNDEIFVSAEYFMDGVGKDIQIAIHDAKTLLFKRAFNFELNSGQKEVSGICVDRAHKTVWMCSWVGENSGNYLYEYDLTSGSYLRKVHIFPVPQWQQGIFYYKGHLYLSADDGDADNGEWDHLYRVNVSEKTNALVTLEKTFDDIKFPGEAEGIAVDFITKEFLIHFNRGKRIVLGMPKGFYKGYNREIHEVYVYKINDKQ
ncbi:hypothetical protein [Candidatus Uabimicrobium sp. HlEnr_7]|uniref:hypothetical protein n=1 Tax=Candidatus Uabimicrobium helgolandensis TaxID=3095367 RepID=UPI003555FAB8